MIEVELDDYSEMAISAWQRSGQVAAGMVCMHALFRHSSRSTNKLLTIFDPTAFSNKSIVGYNRH